MATTTTTTTAADAAPGGLYSFIYNLFSGNSAQPVDLSYGRSSLPFSAAEQKLRTAPYVHTDHTIPFTFKDSSIGFIHYQTWYLSTVKLRNVDVLYVHGYNDYGGRFSESCDLLLEKGFRVIVLDLPGYGRSSGLHSLIDNWQDLIESVRIVIDHFKEQNAIDSALGPNRNLILAGGSMGGFVTISYAITYPESIDAFSVLCPLVYVAGASRPAKILEIVARMIVATPIGRLPLSPANRGKSSSDPSVEEDFLADPQTYHGYMRAASGLSLLEGITWLQANLGRVRKPFLAQHGKNDRVCQSQSTLDLYAQAQTDNDSKTIILYDDCEHDMLREECFPKVMEDMCDWMIKMEERFKE